MDMNDRGMYQDDNKLKEWGTVIGQLTIIAEKMKGLESCIHLKRFAAKAQQTICFNGMSFLYISFIGLVILAFAYIVFSVAGITSRGVLDKMRNDEQSMISKREFSYL